MIGTLLLRGMIVGFAAALVSFGFLDVAGEPAVDRALAFESQRDQAKARAEHDEALAKGLPAPADVEEPALVSRAVQGGIGLFTGVSVYSVAFGGMFALAYALAYGRIGAFSPRATAALLAASGFVALHVAPSLKYPASPPSVGNPDTIDIRTAIYFGMMLLSLAAMIAAWSVRNSLLPRHGAWKATLIGGAVYLGAGILIALAMPPPDPVPEGFPSGVLWQFRMASLVAQAILWTVLGFGFGAWVEHDLAAARKARFRPA